MTQKQRRCPICGHVPLRRALVERTFEYGTDEDAPITVYAREVPIEVCDNCGEPRSSER